MRNAVTTEWVLVHAGRTFSLSRRRCARPCTCVPVGRKTKGAKGGRTGQASDNDPMVAAHRSPASDPRDRSGGGDVHVAGTGRSAERQRRATGRRSGERERQGDLLGDPQGEGGSPKGLE